jgi:hypothetical protein
MNEILRFIAENTGGTYYKSFRYSFEGVEVPTVVYDDNRVIIMSPDKICETDKTIRTSKSVEDLANKIMRDNKPLFRYFLDGTRRTYKVDDISYGERIYPIIAGQILVGCCKRSQPDIFKSSLLEKQIVLVLPDCADKDDKKTLFFNSLADKINNLSVIKKRGMSFQKVLSYPDVELKEGEKYENKGIAKIQDEMVEAEKRMVVQLVKEKKLNNESYLIKDGSIEYKKIGTDDYRDLSAIKSNYRCVVGVSKTFNPELFKDKRHKTLAKRIAELPLFHRTQAFRYTNERAPGVEFCIWYLRIRSTERTVGLFDGVVKVEKILVSDEEQEKGLDSDEIDLISANLVNERNPTCYGLDTRWANHLYPVYLTEKYIKSNYISEVQFLNLF